MVMNMLRFLIHQIFSVVAFWLLLVFFIRIFSPGNADTEVVFRFIAPALPILDNGASLLTLPIQVVLDWVLPYLPAAWLNGFPAAEAAGFFGAIGNFILNLGNLAATDFGRSLAAIHYKTIFPGILDWRMPLTIWFWGWIESLLLQLVIRLEAFMYRQHIRHRDADILQAVRNGQ